MKFKAETLASLLFITTLLLGVKGSQRPNIVLILADDLGWNDVSFHGSRQIPTPNLDALAYDGIILSNYYVQPICTPTRSALMTGRYPIHTGMQHSVIVGAEPYGLGLDEKVMSQYFKELNYSTHIVGKWHLGFCAEEYTPLRRGFDSHFGYYMGAEDYWDHSTGSPPKAWGLDFRRDMEVINTDFGRYSTELFSNEAEKIIQEHNESKPLFLYLPHQAVHSGNPFTQTPLEAPWKYQEKFSHIKNPNRRMFAAMVSALDDAVGNVTKALDKKGLLENTVIVFTTDNGGPAAGFDFNFASNWPLRGLKSTLWEGGARATGFIWSPLLQTTGYIAEQMVHVVDWLPTLLHAAGYDMKKIPDNVDGFDQWDTLTQNGKAYRTEFLYNIDPDEPSQAIRVNNMKLISGKGSTMRYDGWYKTEEVTEKPENKPDFQNQLGQNEFVEHMGKNMENHVDIVDQYNQKVVDTEKARHAFDEPLQRFEEAPETLFQSDLTAVLRAIGRHPPINGKPAVVNCPNRPANYSTNCKVEEAACLFDIARDPCEFNNLADSLPDVVRHLSKRLEDFRKSMVPPRNKRPDPNGLPYYHNGVWVPWLNMTQLKCLGNP